MSKVLTEDSGQWVGDKWLYPNSWGWNINMSSTLTELIHLAGRYTDAWASDLFIFWRYNIENEELKRNKDWSTTWYIGFRESGVDWSDEAWGKRENKVFEQRDKNMYYYRRVVKLNINPDNDKDCITMRLEEIA